MVLVFAKSPEEQVVALQYFYEELVFIRRTYKNTVWYINKTR
jgi:hypothetical protein